MWSVLLVNEPGPPPLHMGWHVTVAVPVDGRFETRENRPPSLLSRDHVVYTLSQERLWSASQYMKALLSYQRCIKVSLNNASWAIKKCRSGNILVNGFLYWLSHCIFSALCLTTLVRSSLFHGLLVPGILQALLPFDLLC